MSFSYEEYADMHFVYGFCNGNTTAAVEEYGLRYPRRRIPDRRVFTRVNQHLREKASFPSVNRHAERQVQRNVEDDEHIIDLVQRSPRTSTRRISARLRIPRMSVWRTLFREGMYPYHIQRVQHLEPADMCSRLVLCRWINSNPRVIRNVLFTDEANFTRDGVNNTRNSHLWGRDNPHGTIESNYQHRFSVSVWCGVIGDQLIGPYIFPQRLTGAIYANFLRDELPALLENVPLQTRLQMYYQHDGAPPHFSQVVRQYLDHKFPNRWIGRGGTQNWPPRSPDLNPLDYHVWGYMKAMVYEQKVNTREELVHRILSAARSINNAAVLRKVTSSLVTRVRKCMEADGGHFENL